MNTSLLFSRRIPLDHLFPLWLALLSPATLGWSLACPQPGLWFFGWCCLAVGLLGTVYGFLEPEEALLLDQPRWSALLRTLWPAFAALLLFALFAAISRAHTPSLVATLVLFVLGSWSRAWSPQLRWTQRGLWRVGRNPCFVPHTQLTVLSLEPHTLVWQTSHGFTWSWNFSDQHNHQEWLRALPSSPWAEAPRHRDLPAHLRSPSDSLSRWGFFGLLLSGSGAALLHVGITRSWSLFEWSLWTLICLSVSRLPFFSWKNRCWSWRREHVDSAATLWRVACLPAGVAGFLLGLTLLLNGHKVLSSTAYLFWAWIGLLTALDLSGSKAWTGWEGDTWRIRRRPFEEEIDLSLVKSLASEENLLIARGLSGETTLCLALEPEATETVMKAWRQRGQAEHEPP